jgi:nitrogen fixation NifU-like protein
MDEMYTERLLDHYRHPRNRGRLEPSDTESAAGQVRAAREYNPLCGDEVTIEALVEAGRVVKVRFHGRGCALCTGSASILTEAVQGRSLEDLVSLDQAEYLRELGASIRPARLKCALLPWVALRRAIFGEEEQDLSSEGGGDL